MFFGIALGGTLAALRVIVGRGCKAAFFGGVFGAGLAAFELNSGAAVGRAFKATVGFGFATVGRALGGAAGAAAIGLGSAGL